MKFFSILVRSYKNIYIYFLLCSPTCKQNAFVYKSKLYPIIYCRLLSYVHDYGNVRASSEIGIDILFVWNLNDQKVWWHCEIFYIIRNIRKKIIQVWRPIVQFEQNCNFLLHTSCVIAMNHCRWSPNYNSFSIYVIGANQPISCTSLKGIWALVHNCTSQVILWFQVQFCWYINDLFKQIWLQNLKS